MADGHEERMEGKISHSSCHSKAWFKAWLGMASSMARHGSLIDQAHHEEHMGHGRFRPRAGQPRGGLV